MKIEPTACTRRFAALLGTAALAAAVLNPGSAAAQEYPTKPITMVVPYAPGGSTDVIGRQFAQRLSEILKQQVVVENKGGAGGVIAFRQVAQAPADGYSLLFSTSIIAITPLTDDKAGYRFEDFVTLGSAGQFPYVLMANEKVPARNVKELVAYAKANPGKLNYVSFGTGSVTTLLMKRFMHEAGINAAEIRYAGSGQAAKDLASGEVQLQFIGATQTNMTAPRMVPIGISDNERVPSAPNVGTFKEAGYPGVVGGTWFSLLASAKTPAPIVQKLRAAMTVAARDLKDKLAANGTYVAEGTVEEFANYIKQDTALWAEDIKRQKAAGQ